MSEHQNRQGRSDQGGHDLVLSVRSARLARDVGAATVGQLVLLTDLELLSAKCFGETSLWEIREKLAERGLRLGMSPDELPGRPGLDAKIVTQGQPGMVRSVTDMEHEEACCGHCQDAARKLRERTAARATTTEQEKVDHDLERKLNMSLAELELSVRATNCLESEGITTVRDLVIRSPEELLELRGFGDLTLKEVKTKLALHGLQLGMRLPVRHGQAQ
jgi:DNA-directed RNA polymerase alpha subunit